MYISSHDIISSLGFGTEENIQNIIEGKTGIVINNNKKLSSEPVYISVIDTKRLESSFARIDKTKNYTRFESLLILSISRALRTSKVNISDSKTIVIISTAKGNIDLLEKKNKSLFDTDRVQLWKSAEIVKDFFKCCNKPLVISNACISGVLGIIVAKRLLENKFYENAIIVGADILSEFTLSGFLAFKAVSNKPCKPFDANRNGMSPGEGAATLIVTNDKSKSEFDGIIISGGASSNDANHISGPSRTGMELSTVMKKAMKDANTNFHEIDYVSAHGTATLYNDESEAKALNLCNLSEIPTNSFKGFLGHTFGAAGVIETIIAISSIYNNLLYKSLGYSSHGTEKQINIIKENKKTKLKKVLKTALGFGGCNAAIVIQKINHTISKNSYSNNFCIKTIKKVSIKKETVTINNKNVLFLNSNLLLALKFVYNRYNIKYPKFYKMDILSKLAFLTSEILLKDTLITKKYKDDEIAVILSSGSSSLQTDYNYQQTISDIRNYFPSPSTFVYTLPNIMVGEICIRNKIKGENTVFISENFDKEFIFRYVNLLFQSDKIKACITGRVEYGYPNGNYESKLYLLEKQ